jgi:single-strand DNA-binding protein
MNEVTLIGNIDTEINVKEPANNKKIVLFYLTTNEKYTNKDGQEETETDWHEILAFDKVAEIIGTFKKGDFIKIKGIVKNNESYIRKDGIRINHIYIKALFAEKVESNENKEGK